MQNSPFCSSFKWSYLWVSWCFLPPRLHPHILAERPLMAVTTIARTAFDIAMAVAPLANRQAPRAAKCTIRIALPLVLLVQRRYEEDNQATADI